MTHDPGKEPIPQTVEELLDENEWLRCELGRTRAALNRAQMKNQTLWKRIVKMELDQAYNIRMGI